MKEEAIKKIVNDPDFITLTRERSKFGWILTAAMLVVYFAFILVIAFNPSLFGTPLSEGAVTTVGIPVGVGVIIFAFVITGIYVKRANSEFDDLTNKIKSKAKES